MVETTLHLTKMVVVVALEEELEMVLRELLTKDSLVEMVLMDLDKEVVAVVVALMPLVQQEVLQQEEQVEQVIHLL